MNVNPVTTNVHRGDESRHIIACPLDNFRREPIVILLSRTSFFARLRFSFAFSVSMSDIAISHQMTLLRRSFRVAD